MTILELARKDLAILKEDAHKIREAVASLEMSLDTRKNILESMRVQLTAMDNRINELERMLPTDPRAS